MYHEVTYIELAKRRRRRVFLALLAAVCAFLLAACVLVVQESGRAQGAASMRAAVLQAALQCCAIEGSYPSSLAYLEEEYGLRINRSDYVVSYEWLGDNVAPSVVVSPR